mgnify:CR=1 FL=1
MSHPLATIVIPSYNHAPYLRQAVDSALSQTIRDIEVVVVDDCSSDDSLEILSLIEDSRLKILVNEENRGASFSLNRAIQSSCAPVIAILNSDDLFEPNRLSICLKVLDNPEIMLVGTGLKLIDASGFEIQDPSFWWFQWYTSLMSDYASHHDLMATLFRGNLFVSTSNFVFRRGLFEQAGPFEPLRYTQDYAFILRVMRLCPQGVSWLPDETFAYRLHDSNTIMEDRISPVLETLKLLGREITRVKGRPEGANRILESYEEHIERLIRYLQEGSQEKAERQVFEQNKSMQDCINSMGQHANSLEAHVGKLQAFIDAQSAHIESMQSVIDGQASHILALQETIHQAQILLAELQVEHQQLQDEFRSLRWAIPANRILKNWRGSHKR